MSSITRQNYPCLKQAISELGTRLQQQMEFCKMKLSQGVVIQEMVWVQLEEDIKYAYGTMIDLSTVLEEEWSTVDKLECFVRNLETINTEIFEENSQHIIKLQQSDDHNAELSKLITELKRNLEAQSKKRQSEVDEYQTTIQKNYFRQHQQLEKRLNDQQRQIQKLILQKNELSEQLALKNTEIQLAQLVIEDLRNDKSKLEQLCSTMCQEKQDALSSNQLEIQSNSHQRSCNRRNSLLQDLIESQLVYEPRVSSQLLKSTQTIQQSVQDRFQNNYIQQRVSQKKSKAISTHFIPQVNDSYTQTEQPQSFYEKCYSIFKDKIISQRIKR